MAISREIDPQTKTHMDLSHFIYSIGIEDVCVADDRVHIYYLNSTSDFVDKIEIFITKDGKTFIEDENDGKVFINYYLDKAKARLIIVNELNEVIYNINTYQLLQP